MSVVLDASALLALLNTEPGWERVAEVLPSAVVSAVNVAEVAAKLADHGVSASEIRSVLAGLGLAVVAFDRATALASGELRRVAGGEKLSLGDRACLQLARDRGEPVLTADRYWSQIEVGAQVLLIR